jgi:hypothetical protein
VMKYDEDRACIVDWLGGKGGMEVELHAQPNGVTVGSTRARTGKPGIQTRPRPNGQPRQLSTLPGEGPGWVTASGYSTDGYS